MLVWFNIFFLFSLFFPVFHLMIHENLLAKRKSTQDFVWKSVGPLQGFMSLFEVQNVTDEGLLLRDPSSRKHDWTNFFFLFSNTLQKLCNSGRLHAINSRKTFTMP